MDNNLLNITGLIIDIIGVVILFIYGLPSEVSKDGIETIVMSSPDETENKKWLKYRFRSRIGLFCVAIGFLFQIASSVTNMNNGVNSKADCEQNSGCAKD